MNLDDLHDPDPPRPGPSTLAAVASRARQLRRRRATLLTAGGVVAAAAVVVPATLAITGRQPDERITSATQPGVVAPVTSSTVPVVPPPVVVGPPTTATGVVPPRRGPATTTTSPLDLTPPPTTTTAPAVTVPELVAIRADGDPVRIAPDGTETVLYDGADPRVPPQEGELTIVDSVVAAPDGRTFVSTCCEPVPGSWFEIGSDFNGYGHGLDLSPDGTRLVVAGADFVAVLGASGQQATGTGDGTQQLVQAMWVDDDTIAVLQLRDTQLSVFTTDAGLTAVTGATGVVVQDGIAEPWPSLAGTGDDGSILVFHPGSMVLHAYDPVTLAPHPDVALPGRPLYAWMQDGVLTWIELDGALHVGDAVVPGEFNWARPLG